MDTLALAVGFGLGAAAMFLIDTFTFIKRAVENQNRTDTVTVRFGDLDENGIKEMTDTIYALWRQDKYDKERE